MHSIPSSLRLSKLPTFHSKPPRALAADSENRPRGNPGSPPAQRSQIWRLCLSGLAGFSQMKNNLLIAHPCSRAHTGDAAPTGGGGCGENSGCLVFASQSQAYFSGGVSQGSMCVLGSQRPEGTVLAFHILRG